MSISLSALQKQRRDTAANWTAEDPILLAGELGYESDTGKWKVGDGATAWTGLDYIKGSQLSAYPLVNADIDAAAEIAVSKLADGDARQLLQTDAAGTGVEWASNIDVPGTLDVAGVATFDSNVTIEGDLTVNGTTTTIDTTTLVVEDKNIELGVVTTPTDVTADGGGITLKGATDKTINWVDATDAWTSSERFSYPLGSATDPALTFTGDPNTGIYSPGADQVAISTNGTGRLFITSNGNVGIGTTSPGQLVHVESATPYIRSKNTSSPVDEKTWDFNAGFDGILRFRNIDDAGTSGNNWLEVERNGVQTGSIRLLTGAGSERLRITSDGKLGLGTSSPANLLDLFGTDCKLRVRDSGQTNGLEIYQTNSDGGNSIYAVNNNYLRFGTNNTERLRIDSSGRLGLGTSSPGALLDLAGNNTGLTSPLNATNRLRFTDTDTTQTNAQPTGTIEWYTSDANSPGVHAYISTDMFNSGTGNLIVGTGAGGSATQKLSIGPGGTVSITVDAATSPLIASIGASEVVRIDSSGRLLVGTSSTSASANTVLQGHSTSSSQDGRLYIQRGATSLGNNTRTGQINFADSVSNIGAAIESWSDDTWASGDYPGRLVFSTTADGASTPTERMRIEKDGITSINTTSNCLLISTTVAANTSNVFFQGRYSGTDGVKNSGTLSFRVFTNGNVENTNNSYGAISDIKLKENIVDASSQWDDLKALQVRNYNFKAETGYNTHTQIGLVAQEVELVSPGLVGESIDEETGESTKSVNYSVLYMKAVKALQEAMERIETLEAKVAALEAS